ncbi:AbrB/MazE/SpoVT family DNA-binding domain-containing protein [Pseudomonas sp. SIMBA_041]|uniref:AbrB/MazE/SpoVT family DNA-binding domain-containing protein n=1 Tax=Pseudomonas sp. SIMBA_041 TaxID=3085782 RepID=UPI00397E2FBC
MAESNGAQPWLGASPQYPGRIRDEALQELELDVGDAVYLIEEFVGNTRCLVLSKTPQIADRIDELTEAWDGGRLGDAPAK